MTSALEMRPKLREDLTMVRRETKGVVDYIVKEPTEGKYSRFGEVEIGLMRLMDGTRSPEEISEAAEGELGALIGPGSIADFAQKLKRLGIVERTPAEQHLMLLERLRSQRKRRAGGRARGSILRMQFSAGDPDRWLARWERWLHWMWSPAFAVLCIALFVAYVAILVVRWPDFFAGLRDFYTASNVSGWDYVMAYGIMLTIIVIHEMGHGLTTKHFGGEVHDMGGMFLYFLPALYCNTNDAWLFERRSHRLWVTFAGPWIQLVVAAIAGIVWLFMEPGSLGFRVTLLAVLLAGMANLVTNLNPLIPLDGYYALSDYLEIPNLRGRAFEYCRNLLRRGLLGLEVAGPPVTPRERRVFLIYGSLAFFYGIFAILIGLMWLVMIFGRVLGPWVWLLIGLLALRMLWPRLVRLRSLAASSAATLAGRWRRSPRIARIGALVAIGVLLLLVLPWTYRAEGIARVEPAQRAIVSAAVPGTVESVLVEEGDTVAAGQPLAVLWNPELEARVLDARRSYGTLLVRHARTTARGDDAGAATATAALHDAAEQLALLEARSGRLVVRAPIAGIVLGHELDERTGEALAEGDSLLVVASPDARVARVRVPLAEAENLARGQLARLKFSAWPGYTFAGRVASVAPAAHDGWIDAVVPLPVDRYLPAPGMAGAAKIVTGRGTIGGVLARAIRHTVRLDLLM